MKLRSERCLLALTGVVVCSAVADLPPQVPTIILAADLHYVPQAAGSWFDSHVRVLAQKMGELWGQQGVVENSLSALSLIGIDAARSSLPHGYTLSLSL